jgi:HEAT repeat protein
MLGDQRAVEYLMAYLHLPMAHGYDRALSARAAKALRKIGPPAVDALIDYLVDKKWSTNEERNRIAAEILGDIGDRRAVSSILTELEAGRDGVCQAAAVALGKIGDINVVDRLIVALSVKPGKYDSKVGVSRREAAAMALGMLGEERSFAPLVAALDDEKWRVREAAVKALGAMGGKKAIQPLIGMLSQEKWSIREAAALSLAELGARQAVPKITTLLNDRVESVREVAMQSLCIMYEKGIVDEDSWRRIRDL